MMNNQLKLQNSSLAFPKNLAIFNPPVTNVTSGNKEIVIFNNKNPLDDNRVLFILEGIRNQLIDLKNTHLYIKGKIVNEDGSIVPDLPTPATWSTTVITGEAEAEKKKEQDREENQNKFKKADVFPVNNLFYSLFKDGTLSLQNSKFYLNDIAYRGILQSYTQNRYDVDHPLINQLYSPPTRKAIKNESIIVTHPNYSSDGEILYNYTKGSNEIEMCGPLLFGICNQDRYLISHIDIQIEFLKHNPDFFLKHPHGSKFKFVYTEIKLRACLVTLPPDIEIGHAEVLQSRGALYPYLDKKLSVHSLTSGSHYFEHNNTWNGDVPSKITIVMLPSENYNGSYITDPFAFEHNYVNLVSISVDNIVIGGKGMHLQIKENEKQSQFLDAYSSLNNDFPTMMLKRESWFNNFPAYHFNISNSDNSDIIPLMKKGLTKIFMNFSQPLQKDSVIIMYAEFPSMVEIDGVRNVKI